MGLTLNEALDFIGCGGASRQNLIESYEPRKYHNLQHLENMLRWVDINEIAHLNATSIIGAILYHDIAYAAVSPRGTNEALSASLYTIFCTHHAIAGKDLVGGVYIIAATAYHLLDQPLLTKETQYVLDLDLQSFAQSYEECARDHANVKAEYVAEGVSSAEFDEGNKKFLQQLLARKRLYYTRPQWETIARENIARLIAQKVDSF
jgi:predicted metal-dependent HD superfamily phosphohydrolase